MGNENQTKTTMACIKKIKCYPLCFHEGKKRSKLFMSSVRVEGGILFLRFKLVLLP